MLAGRLAAFGPQDFSGKAHLPRSGTPMYRLARAEGAAVKLRSIAMLTAVGSLTLASTPASAEPRQRVPFTQSLSNTIPLTFGMTADEAATALGVPLAFVSGRRGNEVLAAARPSGGYFNRDARLFLQFRNSRLTGWKGDWERNWMWE